ncbi:hypothetical protein Dda_5503 [Drechslerella dactyloides]|uniref:Telomerase reverse transcriptase n=1 Tax=Drechslerella dactyloides TaxID=74499 RepID=A0AAD6IWA4_DREDA|nr:hypothetical protein Dda_5503 [Drechslerella dactyloides]
MATTPSQQSPKKDIVDAKSGGCPELISTDALNFPSVTCAAYDGIGSLPQLGKQPYQAKSRLQTYKMQSSKRPASLVGPKLEYVNDQPARKRRKTSQRCKKGKGSPDARAQAQSAEGNQQNASRETPAIHHPILSAYFQSLLPLRQYLALAINSSKSTATSSISRRERLLRFESDGSVLQNDVVRLLDTTVVGALKPTEEIDGADPVVEKALAECLNATQDERIVSSHDELVDCAISILFQKARVYGGWANSVLAAGYRINDSSTRLRTTHKFRQFGLDVVCIYPNPHAAEFRSTPWKTITDIIGQETMLKLLAMQGDAEGAVFFPLSDKVRRGYGPNSLISNKCFQQFLGTPLSEIQLEKKVQKIWPAHEGVAAARPHEQVTFSRKPKTPESIVRTPSEIRFVRSRIFYAKPVNNKNSESKTGLPHIHVLNRYSNPNKRNHKVHALKYIFPRAFDLHNVFTSTVDKRDTAQKFKDYTLREEEIDSRISRSYQDRRLKKVIKKNSQPGDPGCPDDNDDLHHGYVPPPSPLPDISKKERTAYELIENLPQRFRGRILHLVGELIRLQRRCRYHPLLQHYCPSSVINPDASDPRPKVPTAPPSNQTSPTASMRFKTQLSSHRKSTARGKRASLEEPVIITQSVKPAAGEASLQDPILLYAASSHSVYTFLRAVLGNIIPLEFWGADKAALKNREIFFNHMEKFVKLRRYESLTLHNVLQGYKMTDLAWLHQKQPSPTGKVKLDAADMKQCTSLFAEFVYYLFDSLVMPLIRAHFYVTESTSDKNRTCYFRQDVWRKLSSSYVNKMISTMFTDIPTQRARDIMDRRAAKFSTIRLLPKNNSFRFLSNLKRRPMELDPKTGRRVLAKSINMILKPNHVALSFEKSRQPQALGASIFSLGEILQKLTTFRDRLKADGVFGKRKLYFVKADVASAFDTIPQNRVLEVVKKLYVESAYKVRKQGRVTSGIGKVGEAKPKILFPQIAEPADRHVPSIEQNKKFVAETGIDQKSLIFVDRVTCTHYEHDALIRELGEHVSNNFVQIGKRFYRQSVGIPQGSIMSTLLCNLFYADLEARELPFTQARTGLLMRLTDDFLFVTTNRDHAQRFCDAIHKGFPRYGVVVRPEKSLVNFEVTFNGCKIARTIGGSGFPYCGTLIDEKSLEIKRDWSRRDGTLISNLLTVEYGSKPGQKMLDKVLGGWKLVSTAIYLNTGFNSRRTVVTNLYWSFVDAAMKFHRYHRSISSHHRRRGNKSQKNSLKTNDSQTLHIIEEFMSLAYTLMMSRENRTYDDEGAVVPKNGLIGRVQIRWLVAKAFLRVLGKKQTLFRRVIRWLEECVRATAGRVDWVFHRAAADVEVNEIFDSVRY